MIVEVEGLFLNSFGAQIGIFLMIIEFEGGF
jgi:hypothetical protein